MSRIQPILFYFILHPIPKAVGVYSEMKAMFALKIVALTALLLSPTYAGQPKKGTMAISYAPDSALVINEAETQLFR